MMDVGVVIAAWNEELYIERSLRSCLQQSMPKSGYQVVLVDDCSDDATAKIARQFEPHVTVLRNEEHLGLPASINRGIEYAKTRFVVRVDGDDYVHSDFLMVLHLFLEMNTYMDAVACDYYLVDDQEAHLERVNCVERPIGCGIMFRKDRLVSIGLYDQSFLMGEEVDLRLRFERRWRIHRLELPLYRYRAHQANMTRDVGTYESYITRAKEKNRLGETQEH